MNDELIPDTKPVNYVDNKEFHKLLVERRAIITQNELVGNPPPRITNEIGKMILDIATNLTFRRNFIRSDFKADMIEDAIDNCLKYIDNFDSTRKNPFAYFTQICWHAFVRRIVKENRRNHMEGSRLDWDSKVEDVPDNGITFWDNRIKYSKNSASK